MAAWAAAGLEWPAMSVQPDVDVTGLLVAWGGGDEAALHALMPVVERELHRIARACLRSEREHRSVSATVLVNEAFLRLVGIERVRWQDRVHFFAMAARLMRRVLVDLARARHSAKRGGDVVHVSLDDAPEPGLARAADVLRLDEALEALAALDERKARVVELRFFGGLTEAQIAEALQVSAKTVLRDWSFAKAWLQQQLAGQSS